MTIVNFSSANQASFSRFYLSDLLSVEPKFRAPQADTVKFLSECHQKSAELLEDKIPVEKLISRYSVKDSLIGFRSFDCPDMYLPASERKIFAANRPEGGTLQHRTEFFAKRAEEILNEFYKNVTSPPDHIVHVTCTGYVAPSAPQVLISNRKWSTEVTHAYHMGCYAALPSIRLACGQSSLGKNVDVVHTEMCSLHSHSNEHSPEQLIVQTLFADGHIRYRISSTKSNPSFQILAIKELIVPGTTADMSWIPGPFGMVMTLAREVPQKIEAKIVEFTRSLIEEARLSPEYVLRTGLFAIHPGGPKIIDAVSNALNLREEQVAASRRILFERGNMSSATIPHVWDSILKNNPPSGTLVVSLAFGPGLTIFGSVFECHL